MSRPRVEGIGRRVGRSTGGSSGSSYTPTRDTRVLIEDSGFKMFSGGLSSIAQGSATMARLDQREQDEEARRLQRHQAELDKKARAKATYLAKGGRERAEADYNAFLFNNPEYQGLPPEQVLNDSDEAKQIVESHLNATAIPYEDILEKAKFELGTSLYTTFETENAKRIKAKNFEDYRELFRTDISKVSGMSESDAKQHLDGLIKNTGGVFDLTPAEAAQAALDVQAELFNNAETAGGEISRYYMNSEAIPAEMRKAHRDLYEKNSGVRKQAENLKRQRIETTLIPSLIGADEETLKAVYKSQESQAEGIPSLYSWQDFKRLTKETAQKIDKEALRELATIKGAEEYLKGQFNGFYDDETGMDQTKRNTVLAVENKVTEILKTHPAYINAEDKEEALLELQLETAKLQSRVPLKYQEELQASLKFPEDGFVELPNSFINSLNMASKLISKGMLVYAGLNEEEEMKLRSMITITNTMGTSSEAINSVITASKDKDKFLRTNYAAQANIRDKLSSLLDDNPSTPFVLGESSRLYNTFRANGLSDAEALAATEDAIEQNYYEIGGSVYNKRALAGFKEKEVEQVFSSFLDKFVEANPAEDREEVFITEHSFGMYLVTDKTGMPIENSTTGAPVWIGVGNLDEAVQQLRTEEIQSSNNKTRSTQQTYKELKTFENSDEKREAQSAALMFPTF